MGLLHDDRCDQTPSNERLAMIDDDYKTNAPIRIADAMISRSRADLMIRYGLRVNEETGMIEPNGFELGDEEFQLNMRRLLNESMMHCADFLRDAAANYDGSFSSSQLDDSGDYLNAATDQLTWINSTFRDDDGEHLAERTLALLNMTNDEASEYDGLFMPYPYGFAYGYCDHYTPLSALAEMNHDEDDQGN